MPAFTHPRHVLSSLGIHARKRFSQNFICQPSLAARIAALPDWPRDLEVVEIGGGTGSLTDALVDRFADVLVVEVDRALAEYLKARYAEPGDAKITVLEGDARTVELALVRRPPVGVFGNLPYSLTTELFLWLVRQRKILHGAVIMVQREYADRLVARPRTKAYGSLSVYAALHVDVRARFRVGPDVFHPRPGVGSTVLHLTFRDPPDEVGSGWLERVVRSGFAHRRKLLRTNLIDGLTLAPEVVDRALAGVGAGTRARAEELSPETFVDLARRLTDRG